MLTPVQRAKKAKKDCGRKYICMECVVSAISDAEDEAKQVPLYCSDCGIHIPVVAKCSACRCLPAVQIAGELRVQLTRAIEFLRASRRECHCVMLISSPCACGALDYNLRLDALLAELEG